jgi:hypothetical protein
MNKFIALFIVSSISISLFAQKVTVNDANAQERKVSSFTGIKVSSAFDLYLSQDDDEAVAVSAAKKEDRDRIRTEVKDGVLRIWFDDKSNWWKNMGNKKLKAYVSFKTLNSLSASGACDVIVNGAINSPDANFVMDFSGASDFKGEINAKTMKVDLSGASDVSMKGKVDHLDVEASGASEFNGYGFTTNNCNAHASGASGIKVTVNKELNAKASGASGIYYSGEGMIRDHKSIGASSISRRG